MSRVYDNWERLVEATLDREKLRQLAFSQSFSSSIATDFSSRFSFDSPDVYEASRISSATLSPEASSSQSTPAFAVRPITFKEIIKATRNFRPDSILGEGGFGPVFKGWINEYSLTAAKPGSGMVIAVKKLNQDSLQGHKEWLAEVNYLGQLHHPNLVKLIGYCYEDENLILVYEFMPRGSLDNHLFRRAHQSLSWATRIKVAIGAARALSFLHDSEMPVIHRGFKTSDILLDGEFNAKLSDFGLAKDGPTGEMTHISTRVMGKVGYAAPEYLMTGHLTAKCDVYAFGVVLLELLTGRRSIDKTKVTKEQKLVDWAKPYLTHKRKLFRIMDTKLEGQYPQEEAYSVAVLALKCLDLKPKRRPRMCEVLVELEKL